MDGTHALAMIVCGIGALLARVGLALYHAGLVRAKNAAGTVLRHAADFCIATLAFWAVAPAILVPGGRSFLGIYVGHFLGITPIATLANPVAPDLFFLLVTALIGTGILVGALAERTRFFPSLAGSLLLAAIIIPVTQRWAKFGWLADVGFRDLSGASFIHLAAALCALAGSSVIGPREGKYNHDGSSNAVPGHSVPLASTGVLLLLVAWFPYLLGYAGFASAPLVAMNLILAAAAGGLTSLLVGNFRYGKPDVYLTYAGILGGLVAIGACADAVSNGFALLIGAVAGILVPMGMLLVDIRWRIDDPGGGIAIHGVGGAWGLIAAGMLTPASTVTLWARHLGIQILGLVIIGLFAGGLSWTLFLVLRSATTLRPREADEYDGLDLAEHDISAYPDFQQTTIKSYHLREA